MSFELIRKWVDVNTPEGQSLLREDAPDRALFEPADHFDFDPVFWNDFARKVNCLSYALGATGEKLNPGGIAGNKPGPLDDFLRSGHGRTFGEFQDTVRRKLEEDGIHMATDKSALYKKGHYLIALFFNMRPFDCHFLRMDSNGKWSQMNLDTPNVTWEDAHEERIINPARAFFGDSMTFGGFYHVPRGGIDTLRQQKAPAFQPE
jgi:hypothetical protein